MSGDWSGGGWGGNDQWPGPPPERGSVRGAGVFVGIAVVTPLFLVVSLTSLGVFAPVTPLMLLADPIVAAVLIARGDPFWRGVGIGMFIGIGILLLLAGACFAMLAGSDFG